jgi:hypothetical protein
VGQFSAWYVAKKPDGSWDLAWSTKLPVLTWGRDDGNNMTGFVQVPSGDGVVAAHLVPALNAVVTGTDGRTQYFVRYTSA